MSNSVTVYTKNGCPQCDMTKRVLKGEGIEFTTINVDEIHPETKELTEKAVKARKFIIEDLGLSSMPVVIVDDQEPFTGFRPDLLQQIGK
jgi:glutaredoxin-like protein NrdH